jgi:hypothetical protein
VKELRTGVRTAAEHEAQLEQRLNDAIEAREAAVDRELDDMSGQGDS